LSTVEQQDATGGGEECGFLYDDTSSMPHLPQIGSEISHFDIKVKE
jgi:hypothetical protein